MTPARSFTPRNNRMGEKRFISLLRGFVCFLIKKWTDFLFFRLFFISKNVKCLFCGGHQTNV